MTGDLAAYLDRPLSPADPATLSAIDAGPMDPALCSRLGPESNFIPGLKGE